MINEILNVNQLGNFEQALEYFEMSVATGPDDYTHSQVCLWPQTLPFFQMDSAVIEGTGVQAVVTCNQLRKYECALRHAEAAHGLNPGDPNHHRDVAQVFSHLGNSQF